METSAKAGHNVKSLFKKIAMSLPGMEKDTQTEPNTSAFVFRFSFFHPHTVLGARNRCHNDGSRRSATSIFMLLTHSCILIPVPIPDPVLAFPRGENQSGSQFYPDVKIKKTKLQSVSCPCAYSGSRSTPIHRVSRTPWICIRESGPFLILLPFLFRFFFTSDCTVHLRINLKLFR